MNKIEELLKHVEDNCDELCEAAEAAEVVENDVDVEDVGVFSSEMISEILDEMIDDGVVVTEKIDSFYTTTDDDTLQHILDEMVDSHLLLKIKIDGEDRYILQNQYLD